MYPPERNLHACKYFQTLKRGRKREECKGKQERNQTERSPERERERDKQTERQTEKSDNERSAERKSERQTDRQTDRHRESHTIILSIYPPHHPRSCKRKNCIPRTGNSKRSDLCNKRQNMRNSNRKTVSYLDQPEHMSLIRGHHDKNEGAEKWRNKEENCGIEKEKKRRRHKNWKISFSKTNFGAR